MNLREKALYHQVHPAKLLTEWVTMIPSLYLLWEHVLILGLVLTFVPSIVASFIIIRFVDLSKYAESSRGKIPGEIYDPEHAGAKVRRANRNMLGAWYQFVWGIPAGLIIIVLAWFRGIILPKEN